MAILGSTNKQGVSVEYNITFDGTAKNWGTKYMPRVTSSGYEAESRDSKLNVPTFKASLYDPDGSLWTELGDGTTAFNKSFVVGVDVGGTYDWVEETSGTQFKKTSNTGADSFTLHTGKVTRLSKKNRVVSIESRNSMNLIKELSHQLPIGTQPLVASSSSGTRTILTTAIPEEAINENNKLVAYLNIGTETLSSYSGTGLWNSSDVLLGTSPGYEFLDTNWRNTHSLVRFGAMNVANVGTLIWPDDAESDITHFYPVQKDFQIAGDPTNILRHFVTGVNVSDFFLDPQDLGTDSFSDSAKNYAFNYFSHTFSAYEYENKKCFPEIQDIIKITSSLFFIDEDNKINLVTYGPRNLQATVDTLTGTDITEMQVFNEIEDSYNKVTLNYGYNLEDDKYTKSTSSQTSDWSGGDNRELIIETKWMSSKVEANVSLGRLFNRYKNTTPRIEFDTTLSQLGRGIGSLIKVTDSDSGLNEKLIQINAYNAHVIDDKRVHFKGLDGDSLWKQSGYAFWEDEGTVTNTVGTDNTSGWATSPTGTVNGINEDLYGTAFVWW